MCISNWISVSRIILSERARPKIRKTKPSVSSVSSSMSYLCLSRGLRVGGYSDVWVPWKLPWALSPGLGIGWPLTSSSIFFHCLRANRKSTCSVETFSLRVSWWTQKSTGTWWGRWGSGLPNIQVYSLVKTKSHILMVTSCGPLSARLLPVKVWLRKSVNFQKLDLDLFKFTGTLWGICMHFYTLNTEQLLKYSRHLLWEMIAMYSACHLAQWLCFLHRGNTGTSVSVGSV